MKRILYTLLIILLAFNGVCKADSKKYVLVIDAGHGGHDAGAVGAFSKEKDINLNVALAFGRYVERNCSDVKVIYTRKTDVFIPLHQRADIANKNHADVFISIHTNALPAGRLARGLETYTMGMRRSDEKLSAAQRENSVISIEKDYQEHYAGYDPNSPESAIMFEFIHDNNMVQSVELAKLVQKNVCASAGRPDKGVKQDVFLVLRETSMPACLIELGFISTPDEERMLNDAISIDNMARGIYQAFVSYKNKGKGVPAPQGTVQPVAVKYKADMNPIQEPKVDAKPVAKENNPSIKESKPAVVEQKKQETKVTANTNVKPVSKDSDSPVFMVQILTSDRPLKSTDARFKGLSNVGSYNDGAMIKYTYGESKDYQEVVKSRKDIQEKFPDAFIVAFKKGERMILSEAIQEYKAGQKK